MAKYYKTGKDFAADDIVRTPTGLALVAEDHRSGLVYVIGPILKRPFYRRMRGFSLSKVKHATKAEVDRVEDLLRRRYEKGHRG